MTKKTQKGKTVSKPKKVPAAKDSIQVSLLKELRSLLPKLDSEGLAFLVKQARVHIYNMQVDELNKAAEAAYSASNRSKNIKGKPSKKQNTENFDIDKTGGGYYLRFRNDGVMFSNSEMTQLVKLVYSGGTTGKAGEETGARLYNWFDRERRDVFFLIPVKNKNDEILKVLASFIKKNFRLRENA